MSRLKVLLRDPAMLLDLVESGLVMLVALGLHITHDQETNIVAVLIAVIGLLKGLSTIPFPVHIITDLGRALLVLAASYGLNLPPDKIAIFVTFLGTLTTLVGSIRTTPRHDPVIAPGGAGGGPVAGRDEAGYTRNGIALGLALIVIGLIVWLLTGYAVVGIILLVVGIVLMLIL